MRPRNLTPERVTLEETILKLWAEEIKGQEIADRLGVTRNVVMGIVHRARKAADKRDLAPVALRETNQFKPKDPTQPKAPKAPKAKPRGKAHTPPRVAPVWVRTPDPVLFATPTEGVPLMDLKSHHCRWVTDKRAPFAERHSQAVFCGAHVVKPGSSYCAEHHGLVYPPPNEQRRMARTIHYGAGNAAKFRHHPQTHAGE